MYVFILFVAVLGPHCSVWAFSSCHEWELLSSCGAQTFHYLHLLQSVDCRAHRLQLLRHSGLVALRHVESSWTKDRTYVLCTGRWILNHWTTREV